MGWERGGGRMDHASDKQKWPNNKVEPRSHDRAAPLAQAAFGGSRMGQAPSTGQGPFFFCCSPGSRDAV